MSQSGTLRKGISSPSPDWVSAFLFFGYVPDPNCHALRSIALENFDARSIATRDLLKLAIDRLDATVARVLQERGGSDVTHFVPLSGGLDSRVILAALLRHVPPHAIRSLTFGTPGSWDYEIGLAVGRAAGLRQAECDLTTTSWFRDASVLSALVGRLGSPLPIFEAVVNERIRTTLSANELLWSGFLGEATTGGHLPPREITDWSEAVSYFVRWNRYAKRQALAHPSFDPRSWLPDEPILPNASLGYVEQLDLGIRQQNYIGPIVIGETARQVVCPFAAREWISFSLGLPRTLQQHQKFYKALLQALSPRLASLPLKQHYGLAAVASPMAVGFARRVHYARSVARRLTRRHATSPGVNYLDFNCALRYDEALRDLSHTAVDELERLGIVDWLSPRRIWEAHLSGEDNALPVILLISLEMFVSTRKSVCDVLPLPGVNYLDGP